MVEGRQGHAPCRILSLQHILFLVSQECREEQDCQKVDVNLENLFCVDITGFKTLMSVCIAVDCVTVWVGYTTSGPADCFIVWVGYTTSGPTDCVTVWVGYTTSGPADCVTVLVGYTTSGPADCVTVWVGYTISEPTDCYSLGRLHHI